MKQYNEQSLCFKKLKKILSADFKKFTWTCRTYFDCWRSPTVRELPWYFTAHFKYFTNRGWSVTPVGYVTTRWFDKSEFGVLFVWYDFESGFSHHDFNYLDRICFKWWEKSKFAAMFDFINVETIDFLMITVVVVLRVMSLESIRLFQQSSIWIWK